MIVIKKKSREAIYFIFDTSSAFEFLTHLDELRQKKQARISAFDGLQEKIVDILFFMGNEELVEITKNELKFWFTEDALEYAEFKITEFLRVGHISPAEFFEFTCATDVKKKNYQVQTYFMC